MKMKRFLAAVLCLAMLFSLTACSAGDYKDAAELAENGDWAGARLIFSALGDYKDAADRVNECDYQLASADMEAGKYDDAITVFEGLGSYKDAADKVLECRYQKAQGLFDAVDYEAAEALFAGLGEYRDAADRIPECQYARALSLYEEGSYQEALDIFTLIPTQQEAGRYIVICSLLIDTDDFVDTFVYAMNTMLAETGLDMVFEEDIVSYECDERCFYADYIEDRHDIFLTFECEYEGGFSRADGQINTIVVYGDTYTTDDFEQIISEFLYTALYSGCILDDETMMDPAGFSERLSGSFTDLTDGFSGTGDYVENVTFEFKGYECTCAVLLYPGSIYRFIYSMTIPELLNK